MLFIYQAYEVFINETLTPSKGESSGNKVTSSELLSNYCDNLMKNEKVDPDELEAKLHKIVCLFSNIRCWQEAGSVSVVAPHHTHFKALIYSLCNRPGIAACF